METATAVQSDCQFAYDQVTEALEEQFRVARSCVEQLDLDSIPKRRLGVGKTSVQHLRDWLSPNSETTLSKVTVTEDFLYLDLLVLREKVYASGYTAKRLRRRRVSLPWIAWEDPS